MNALHAPIMPTRADFDKETKLLPFLGNQLQHGRVALFLGAGISMPFDLPSWPNLLLRMFKAKSDVPNKRDRVEKQAESFSAKYCPKNHLAYVTAIHDALYEGVKADFQALQQNATLAAIGSLVMASRRGCVSHVVTFNFDNLLETYLRYYGYVVRSVSEQCEWAGAADVTVLHPHGFVPYLEPASSSSQIIFDRSSYAKVIGDNANPWRQQLLCILRSHTCLFVGLSGDDDNLLSLLMECKDSHVSRKHNSAFWGITFATAAKDDADIWEKNGVYRKKIANYDVDLPRILFAICQEAARASG